MEPNQPQQVTPNGTPQPQTVFDPGRGFGIASLVLALCTLGLFAVIFGIIGLRKSRRAGHKNGMAVAGIIVGSVEIVIGILGLIFIIYAANLFFTTCNELGNGTHTLTNGAEIRCNF